MPGNPLFYSSVVPLNKDIHRTLRLKAPDHPLAYAASTHLIPALVEEFAIASRHFPVVFVPTDAGFASVFLCGLQPGQNLFVTAEGRWQAPYLPAYVRRYPFILGDRGADEPIVCIDDKFAGFVTGDEGEALFKDDGTLTDYLSGMVRFVRDYAASATRTDALCARLNELKLLRSITITVSTGKRSNTVHGLFMVDEEKLNALLAAEFETFRTSGVLAAVYAHLFSTGSTRLLSEFLQAGAEDAGKAETVGA